MKYIKKNKNLRYFWLDTICINQKNIKEKEKEIKNMKYYYSFSSMTIILTELDIDEEKIQLINMLSIIDLEGNKSEHDEYESKLILLFHEILSNIKFNDDWNERCWTYQESILNKNIFIYIYNNDINGFLLLKGIYEIVFFNEKKKCII